MSHIFIEQQPLIPVAMTLMVVNKVLMFYHLKTRRGVSNSTIDTYLFKFCFLNRLYTSVRKTF